MLTASLLSAVETHSCFSGCYGNETSVMVSVDPNQPVERVLHASCEDCLVFHVGVLARYLPAGMTAEKLADELSEHMRKLRGYEWAVGGYHARGSLWLSAAYYRCGVFLISGERNRNRGGDLDALLEGFKHGVVRASDPAMLQPSAYRTQTVYVDMSTPIMPVHSSQDLLASSQCSVSYKRGFREVTLAEFLPVVQKAGAGRLGVSQPAVGSGSPRAGAGLPGGSGQPAAGARRAMRLGERCPVCGAIVQERPSLFETYIGCLC